MIELNLSCMIELNLGECMIELNLGECMIELNLGEFYDRIKILGNV